MRFKYLLLLMVCTKIYSLVASPPPPFAPPPCSFVSSDICHSYYKEFGCAEYLDIDKNNELDFKDVLKMREYESRPFSTVLNIYEKIFKTIVGIYNDASCGDPYIDNKDK